jgi:hypothetical protein
MSATTFNGAVIVLSGKFSRSRDSIQRVIETHGGVCASRVDDKTTFLVSAYRPGNRKFEQAKTLSVPIISEADFWHMVSGYIGHMSPSAIQLYDSLHRIQKEAPSVAKTSDGYRRSLVYLRGYADGARMTDTQKALMYFDDFHAGQTRNDGLPFASHPLFCAGLAVSLGIVTDGFISALLFHDVIEDTQTRYSDLIDLGFSSMTMDIIELMSKTSHTDVDTYFRQMYRNPWALLGKLIDRIHNMSTMVGVFKHGRARRFIIETKVYVYPMIDELKKHPDVVDRQTLYALKFMLEALVDSADAFYPVEAADTTE